MAEELKEFKREDRYIVLKRKRKTRSKGEKARNRKHRK